METVPNRADKFAEQEEWLSMGWYQIDSSDRLGADSLICDFSIKKNDEIYYRF